MTNINVSEGARPADPADQTPTHSVPGSSVPAGPAPETWSVAEAKAHLSELLQQAESTGPQVITRRGQQVAVVVSAEEWHRKTSRSGSLAEFFARSPLAGSGLEASRDRGEPREVSL